jgi:hypothetical protein
VPVTKVPERASPARDSVAPLIDAILVEDLDAPRKAAAYREAGLVPAAGRARRGVVVLVRGEVRGAAAGDRGGAEGAGGEAGGGPTCRS